MTAARATGLGHASTRLLVDMAITVRDRPTQDGAPEGRYYGGRVSMAMGLGYGAEDPDEADTRAAHGAVERALAACKKAGLVKLSVPATNHRNAEYDLAPLLDFVQGAIDR